MEVRCEDRPEYAASSSRSPSCWRWRRPRPNCPAAGEGGAQIDPILLSGVERGHDVHVEIDAVVAEEVVQIGERGWMLGAALNLPGENFAFPAGTALAPGFAAHQATCLPLAPVPGPAPVRAGGTPTTMAGWPA